jgi:DNA-binding NarL/FixJ family response regulator
MKILIADDHGIVRQGLASLIEKQPDMEVVGEATDGQKALELVKELAPDVVIMDISMPNLNGIEATRLIRRDHPETRVVAFSMHTEKHIVGEILKAGASAYVLKSYLFDELSRALEAAAAGEHYLSPRIAGVILQQYTSHAQPNKSNTSLNLTPREMQVLQLTAEGKNIKQIALQLHISPKTADATRRRVMEKLGTSSIAELTKYAIREGITSLDF